MANGPEFSPHDEMAALFDDEHPYNGPAPGDVLTDDEAIHDSLLDAADDTDVDVVAPDDAEGRSLLGENGVYSTGGDTAPETTGAFDALSSLGFPDEEDDGRARAYDSDGREIEVIEEESHERVYDSEHDIVDAELVEDEGEPYEVPSLDDMDLGALVGRARTLDIDPIGKSEPALRRAIYERTEGLADEAPTAEPEGAANGTEPARAPVAEPAPAPTAEASTRNESAPAGPDVSSLDDDKLTYYANIAGIGPAEAADMSRADLEAAVSEAIAASRSGEAAAPAPAPAPEVAAEPTETAVEAPSEPAPEPKTETVDTAEDDESVEPELPDRDDVGESVLDRHDASRVTADERKLDRALEDPMALARMARNLDISTAGRELEDVAADIRAHVEKQGYTDEALEINPTNPDPLPETVADPAAEEVTDAPAETDAELAEAPTPPAEVIDTTGFEAESAPEVEIVIPESADVNPNGRELEDALRSPAVVGQMAENLGISRLNADGSEKAYEDIQAEITGRVQAEGYSDGTYSFEAHSPKVDIATQLRERLADDSLDADSRAQLERLLAVAETEPGLAEAVSSALINFENRPDGMKALDEENENSLRNSVKRAVTLATTSLFARELGDEDITSVKKAKAANVEGLDEGMQDYDAVRAKIQEAMDRVLYGDGEIDEAIDSQVEAIETEESTGRVSLRDRWNKIKLQASMGVLNTAGRGINAVRQRLNNFAPVRETVAAVSDLNDRRFQAEVERRIGETEEQAEQRQYEQRRNRLVGAAAAAAGVALYFSDTRLGGSTRDFVESASLGMVDNPFQSNNDGSVAQAAGDFAEVFGGDAAEATDVADAADASSEIPTGTTIPSEAADAASTAGETATADAPESGTTTATTVAEATDSTAAEAAATDEPTTGTTTATTTPEAAETTATESSEASAADTTETTADGGAGETAGDDAAEAGDSSETTAADEEAGTDATETAETESAEEASESTAETDTTAEETTEETATETDTETTTETVANDRIELAEDFNVDSLEIGSLDAGDTVSGEYRTWAENELGLTGEALDDFTGRAGVLVENKNPNFDFTQMLPDVDYSEQFDQLSKDELQGILDDVTGYDAAAEAAEATGDVVADTTETAAEVVTEAADTGAAETATEAAEATTDTAEQVVFEDTIEAGDGVTNTIGDYVSSEYGIDLNGDQLGEVWGDIRSNHAPTEITSWFPGSAEGSEWGVFYPSTGEGGLTEAGKAELDEILKRLGHLKADSSS